MKDIDLLESVNKQDFIILISTEANLNRFPYGFLDELEKAYTHPNNAVKMTPEEKEKLIREIMTQIRNSPESMVQIKKKAIDKNVTVEEMIRLDAGWIYDNKYGSR
ncbi:MAG: hypothetical protein IPH84_20105 [Bacteroidales bacterium]|nr:hypothetical protein [Bacteroidales bacterium]